MKALNYFLISFIILTLPFFNYKVFGLSNAVVTNLVAIYTFFVLLISVLTMKQKFKVTKETVFYFILLLFNMSLLFSSTLQYGTSTITEHISLLAPKFLFFLAPFYFIDDQKKLKYFCNVFLISGITIGLGYLLIEYNYLDEIRTESGRFDLSERSTGILGNFGDISIILSVCFIIVISRIYLYKNVLYRWMISAATFISILISLQYSQSRNLLLTLIVILFVSIAIQIDKKIVKLQARFLLIVIGILVVMASYMIILNNIDYLSKEGRLFQYLIGASNIFENPIFGKGLNYYKIAIDNRWNIHNVFLNIFYSGGFVSLLLFIYPMVKSWNRIKGYSKLKYFYLFCLTGLIFPSLFFPAINSIIFWFVLGFVLSISNVQEPNKIGIANGL